VIIINFLIKDFAFSVVNDYISYRMITIFVGNILGPRSW